MRSEVNLQELVSAKEAKELEVEHLKIKVQSVDLERKKALDDQVSLFFAWLFTDYQDRRG